MTRRRLTDKQERFAQEYATNGGVATAAYRTAYDAGGMTAKNVHEKACRLLALPAVAARVDELKQAARQQVEEQVVVTAVDVSRSAKRAMLADLAQCLDAGGHPLPFEQWPEDLRLAIDSVEFETTFVGDSDQAERTQVTKVKLSPRAVARDQIAKHLGWYERDNAQRRPHESMTDEQLRAAIAAELAAAGLGAPAGAGDRAEGEELPAKPGGLH